MKEVEASTHQAKVLRRDNSGNLYYLQFMSDIFKKVLFHTKISTYIREDDF